MTLSGTTIYTHYLICAFPFSYIFLASMLQNRRRLLLGVILAQKEKYKDAADNLRTYLKLSPNASDAATVQQMLADIEKASGEQKTP